MRPRLVLRAGCCVGLAAAAGACATTRRPPPSAAAASLEGAPPSDDPTLVAPTMARPTTAQTGPGVPGRCVTPASERPGEVGCYLTASATLGALPAAPAFWHLDAYPTRAAAEAADAGGGTVVESLGRVWRFTIAPADWRAAGGEHVARVGPLPVTAGRAYTARYMESVMPPGPLTTVHRHSGAEAWYVVAGAQCVETPGGTTIMRAGESGVVPAGPPMLLVGVGGTVRRVLVLVLHDPAQPWITHSDPTTADWMPTGACPG